MKHKKSKIFLDLKTKFSNKAQIQMMETVGVLIIFFILASIVFVFYVQFSAVRQAQSYDESTELESIRLSQLVTFLPELQCSSKNIIDDDCFDKEKIKAFNETKQILRSTYAPIFALASLSIYELEGSGKWNIYHNPGTSSYYSTIIPISLKDPNTGKKSFGVLNVTYYTPT